MAFFSEFNERRLRYVRVDISTIAILPACPPAVYPFVYNASSAAVRIAVRAGYHPESAVDRSPSTACCHREHHVDIAFAAFDQGHLPAPPGRRLALSLILAGKSLPRRRCVPDSSPGASAGAFDCASRDHRNPSAKEGP